ncbi:MAG: ribosome maturation factor RimM [Paludibacter sp.]|nr:ribosome maturation factor RimM [Paludibacter sp.]
MIKKNQLFPIGQINKPHGIQGEMLFGFTTDIFEVEELPFFIFELDGIFVPFVVAECRLKSASTGILLLDGVNSDEDARPFSGLQIYILKEKLDLLPEVEVDLDYLVGFQLKDIEKGLIGVVSEIDRTTENTLFVIQQEEDELLIPVSEEYIREIDHDNNIILVELPGGLLDL